MVIEMNSKGLYLFMRGISKFIHLIRSNFLSFTTIITILFIYHIFFVMGMGSASFLSHVASSHTIRAYLNIENAVLADNVINEIKSLAAIESMKYYSQKESKEFAIKNAPRAAGLSSFSEEFFPPFIEIIPVDKSIKALEALAEKVSKLSGVDEASFGKEYVAKFLSISRGAWAFIIATSVLFALALIFIIYSSVRICLYRFRQEIQLYNLVGATKPFIMLPYIFAGLLLTLFAFILSVILFYLAFIPFNTMLLIPSGINIFSPPSALYFFILLGAVLLITLLASSRSVARFLRQVSSINE